MRSHCSLSAYLSRNSGTQLFKVIASTRISCTRLLASFAWSKFLSFTAFHCLSLWSFKSIDLGNGLIQSHSPLVPCEFLYAIIFQQWRSWWEGPIASSCIVRLVLSLTVDHEDLTCTWQIRTVSGNVGFWRTTDILNAREHIDLRSVGLSWDQYPSRQRLHTIAHAPISFIYQ